MIEHFQYGSVESHNLEQQYSFVFHTFGQFRDILAAFLKE